MRAPPIWARIAWLLAALAFVFAAVHQHEYSVPVIGGLGAVVLVLLARRNARKRKR